MFDQGTKFGLAGTLLVTLLAAGAAAAGGDARLVEAARNQDDSAIRLLLSQHVDVNSRSDEGSTALLWAAHWNDLTAANLLLQAGADANAANDFHMTPLSQACTNGSAALVELLLKSGANPNTAIATGETPLMTCAKTGNAEAVRALIAHDAAVNAKEPLQNQTALMWAAAERHANVVKELVDAHADLNAHTKQGFTALHFAAQRGDQESAQILLAAGMDVNLRTQPDASRMKAPTEQLVAGRARTVGLGGTYYRKNTSTAGYTPLLVATVRGEVAMALFLLDQGADPNIGDAGFTPLHWASTEWESYTANPVYGFEDPMGGIPDRQAKLRLVRALLAHGANPNARMTTTQPPFAGGYMDAVGATPFLLASSVDDLEMMKILLAAGADPKIPTGSETTAILAATALYHGVGKSGYGSAGPGSGQVSAGSRHGPQGYDDLGRKRLVWAGLPRLEYAAGAIDRSGRRRE